jgi:hypothetical protein
MKIRPEQMAAFAGDRLDELVATAAIMITTRYPEVAYYKTAEELDALVRCYIDEAVAFGLTSERGALKYIEYRIELREGLDPAAPRKPGWEWVREILMDPRYSEEDKLARIDHLAYGAKRPGNKG